MKSISTLTVHLLHGLDKVLRLLEADETEAATLPGALVPKNFRALERRELVERSDEQLIVDIVPQVSREYPVVIIGPIRQGSIFPHLSTRCSHRLLTVSAATSTATACSCSSSSLVALLRPLLVSETLQGRRRPGCLDGLFCNRIRTSHGSSSGRRTETRVII